MNDEPIEAKKRTIDIATSIAGGVASVMAQAAVRTNLTGVHLMGAARFSRAATEAERAGPEATDYEDVRQNAIACIMLAVASLEAYSHEMALDLPKDLPEEANAVISSFHSRFFGKDAGSMSFLSRFDLVLFASRRYYLDRGATYYQNIHALIELRNALTHFRPEWDNQPVKHKTISGALRGRFKLSTIIRDVGEDIFPRKWVSASCTAWAVNSVLAFAQEFERLSGLPSRYAGFEDRLTV